MTADVADVTMCIVLRCMGLGFAMLVMGCGEAFTSGEETRALETGGSAGDGGEASATGGVSGSGGMPSTGGVGVTGGTSGVGSGGAGAGTGGAATSGGGTDAAGSSGMAGGAGVGGGGGAAWMPSRCAEPSDFVRVALIEPWKVSVRFVEGGPAELLPLRVSEISGRYWAASEEAPDCVLTDHGWSYGSGLPDASGTATVAVEAVAHETPEGRQTHVITLGQTDERLWNTVVEHRLNFGGCEPWLEGTENDYSAARAEHVGVYVRGALVAGCEP